VVTGLAAVLPVAERHRRHDLLTVIVPGAADVAEAESLLGECARVVPAAADAGAAGRVHPEALRRIINADAIVAFEGDEGRAWMPILGVGGIGATLAAVTVPRIFVASEQAVAPLLPIYRRPPRLASCFDRVLVDPGAEPDPLALARAILAIIRPLGTAPFAA
jgi:hypothetical protein